jgi:serine/threonine protein kinase
MSTGQGKIFSPGNIIQDKWVILEFIGKGAFGEVYRAHQLNLQRDVAIKVVSQEWLKSSLENDEEIDIALERFRREAQAMARIRHPNVLQAFDSGSTEVKKNGKDYPVEFIVIDYIPGNTLRFTMSEEGFYPEADLLKEWLENYYFPMLNGVKAIHALGMVHRDLKPENILMDDQTPKIADFGLARSSRLKPVTQSMDVKGTAHYMSPEHFFDFRKVDHRADIFSLGKILHEAIDGKFDQKSLPFKASSLANPDTPFFRKLDQTIRDATAEKKEDRLDSVDKLHNALLEAITDLNKEAAIEISVKPKRLSFLHKPRWIWTGVVLAVLSVAAMTVWHMLSTPGKQLSPKDITRTAVESVQQPQLNENKSAAATKANGSQPILLTEDGTTLRLIPGGTVALPAKSATEEKRAVRVDPFYLDEAPVTNHQYVEFLNHNLSRIRVVNRVVHSDDEIWLLLGNVTEGYEPVVFHNGNFKLTNATYASFPVLRVTAYGASAYARFYDRRLPTLEEWLYVFGNGQVSEETAGQKEGGVAENIDMEKMHETMGQDQNKANAPMAKTQNNKLSPVSSYMTGKYEIRVVPQGFGEWSFEGMTSTSKERPGESRYVLMPSGVPRQPWEAFEEVGFRSAFSIGK